MPEPTRRLTDERLCWLAMREYCAQQSNKRGIFGWLKLFTRRNHAVAMGGNRSYDSPRFVAAGPQQDHREQMTGKMGDYAFAVDDAAQTLSAEERKKLRATGEVPDWFLADVDRRFDDLRRKR